MEMELRMIFRRISSSFAQTTKCILNFILNNLSNLFIMKQKTQYKTHFIFVLPFVYFGSSQKYSSNRLQYKWHKRGDGNGNGDSSGNGGSRRFSNKSINNMVNSTHFPKTTTTTTTTTTSTTVNPLYEYSEEKNAIAEHEFQCRRDHLWQMCSKYEFIDRYPPNAWEFFISPGHGIAWCNVFKAASSTWMYYFNILGKIAFFFPLFF